MACVVKGCQSHPSVLEQKPAAVSFYRFPLDPDVKKKWLKNIARSDWLPTNDSTICSLHFDTRCFRDGLLRTVLHFNAVPTIFPNQGILQEKIPNKQEPSAIEMSTLLNDSADLDSVKSEPAEMSPSSEPEIKMETVETSMESSFYPDVCIAAPGLTISVPTVCIPQFDGTTSQCAAIVSQSGTSTSQSVVTAAQPVLFTTKSASKVLHLKVMEPFKCDPLSTVADEDISSRILNQSISDTKKTITTKRVTENDDPTISLVSSMDDVNKQISTLKSKLLHYKRLAITRGRKLRNAQKKCSKWLLKATSLEITIGELQKRNIENEYIAILHSARDCSAQILARYLMKLQGCSLPREYPDEIKKFSSTLQYISPRAYEYVRNTFKDVLPHPKHMSRMYETTDYKPGFVNVDLDMIKLRCAEATQIDKTEICELPMDEVESQELE